VDDEEVELLLHRNLNYVSPINNGCAYFQKGVLQPILTGLLRNGSPAPQQATALLGAVRTARFRWVKKVSQMVAAEFGNARPTTWSTRVNCRPVMVNVTPQTHACGFIRICPFCYARKCWSEYQHLRNIMFVQGEPHSWRRVTADIRRFHAYARTPAELEQLIRAHLTSVRGHKASQTFKAKLKNLKGWFRSHKLWVTELPGRGFRLDIETSMLGTTLGEEIPATLFLSNLVDLKSKKNLEMGLVGQRTWYNPRLKEATFRKWMQRIMRYKKEWLDNDIETTMAYNTVLHDMRFQQFYSGGEFLRRTKQRRGGDNQTTE
jgi:hypothetical protein